MKTNRRLVFILDVLFLAALFWVVRYWHSRQFGLYEDDLTIIPGAVIQSFSSLSSYIFLYITQMYGHARPFSDSFIYLFSWIGWRTIGLWGPYFIGYLITAINISMFYWLVRRVANHSYALLAGLGYLLYSADTTQAFLTHSLGLQPSIMLIMLALHSYLSNKRILAYGLAFLVLFSYETPFLLFVAAPLLKKTWNRALIKEILWHVGIVIGMLGFIYIFRASIGAGRVSELGLKEMLMTPTLHVLQGPIVSMWTYAYRPYQTIRAFNEEIGLAVVVSFAVFIWITSRLSVSTHVNIKDLWRAVKDPFVRRALPEGMKSLGRFFITGIIMLAAAYPLTFTVEPYEISGRATRVHAAGVAGAGLLVASLALFLIYLTNGSNWRKLVNVLVSLELALMVGYGFVIQRDYVLAWQNQQKFWTELLPLIGDAIPTTVILVDPTVFMDVTQIDANTWNLPRILNQLYIFPPEEINIPDLQAAPRVFRLRSGWDKSIVTPDGKFQLNEFTTIAPPSLYTEVESQQVIFIDGFIDGHIFRRSNPLSLGGLTYMLKPLSEPVLPELPHGLLYDLLVIPP